MNYVCSNEHGRCHAVDGMLNKYFYDYEHHNLKGAKFFATIVDDVGWLAPLIRALEPSVEDLENYP